MASSACGGEQLVIQSILQFFGALTMSTRTVRLDDEAERTLAALQKATGLSISGVLKRGLHAYASIAEKDAPVKPHEVYRQLEIGASVKAAAPLSGRKEQVTEIVRKKYGR